MRVGVGDDVGVGVPVGVGVEVPVLAGGMSGGRPAVEVAFGLGEAGATVGEKVGSGSGVAALPIAGATGVSAGDDGGLSL